MANLSNCPSCGAPLKVKKNKTGESVCGFCGFQISSTKMPNTEKVVQANQEEFYEPDPPQTESAKSQKSKSELVIEKSLPAETPAIPDEVIQVTQKVKNATRIVIFVVAGLIILSIIVCVGFGLLVFPIK